LADIRSLNVDDVYGFRFLSSCLDFDRKYSDSIVDTASISTLAIINLSSRVSTILPQEPKKQRAPVSPLQRN